MKVKLGIQGDHRVDIQNSCMTSATKVDNSTINTEGTIKY